MNTWLAEIDDCAAAEIVTRMRKGEDLGFATGLSEIVLHAALRRLGFRLEPHPEIPGTKNKPDFLLWAPNGGRLAYIEVTTINPPDMKTPRDKREAVVFQALDNSALPEGIRLSYEVASYGNVSPSLSKIKTAVERWAAENAEAARASAHVSKDFEADDWRFRLGLIAGFKPRSGGQQIAMYGAINGRIVGAPPSSEGLRRALESKATKYGELDLPYAIAVFDRTDALAYLSSQFPRQVAEVLFGSERWRSTEDVLRMDRAANGWFGLVGAPRRQGVSAVLVFPSAEPWFLAEPRGQPLLVRHPWATRPLPDGILPTNEFVANEREVRVLPGRPFSKILDLPEPWPPIE